MRKSCAPTINVIVDVDWAGAREIKADTGELWTRQVKAMSSALSNQLDLDYTERTVKISAKPRLLSQVVRGPIHIESLRGDTRHFDRLPRSLYDCRRDPAGPLCFGAR